MVVNVVLRTDKGEFYFIDMEILKCSKKFWILMGDMAIEEDQRPYEQIYIHAEIETEIMKTVLRWAIHHKDDPPCPIDLTEETNSSIIIQALYDRSKTLKTSSWDLEYMRNMEIMTMAKVFTAAMEMGMTDLMSLCCTSLRKIKLDDIPKDMLSMFKRAKEKMEREKMQNMRETAQKNKKIHV